MGLLVRERQPLVAAMFGLNVLKARQCLVVPLSTEVYVSEL